MKPDWDKLGNDFKDSDAVTIADVDCTDKKSEQLCAREGVRGYPTIKYYLPGKKGGIDYSGAREYGPLKAFVQKTFKSSCDIATGKGCAANEKAFIEKWTGKEPAEIAEELTKRSDELKGVQKEKTTLQAELKTKIKELEKKEKLISKSVGLLKKMAPGGGKTDKKKAKKGKEEM